MSFNSKRFAAAIAATLMLAATGAQAAGYTFSQGGYDEGASISGGFNGVDLDNNGLLDASFDEISGFFLNFSGNSPVSAFTLHQSDDLNANELVGLVYDLTKGAFIGDDGDTGTGEGIGAWSVDLSHLYLSGIGPNAAPGGSIKNLDQDFNIAGMTSTDQLVSVSAVPEPETYAMLLAGLGLIGLRIMLRS